MLVLNSSMALLQVSSIGTKCFLVLVKMIACGLLTFALNFNYSRYCSISSRCLRVSLRAWFGFVNSLVITVASV